MSHNWSSWNDHQSSSWSQWSSYRSPLPSSWKPDDTHHDSHLVHGYPLFRTIQPTAWTRKKGIHGLDPLEIPVHQLCRYGLQEFSLRPLSAGRFVGLVCTRSVAESVFTAQLLKALRENAIDVDSIAEHLHQTASSTHPEVVFLRVLGTKCPFQLDHPVLKGHCKDSTFHIFIFLVDLSSLHTVPCLAAKKSMQFFSGIAQHHIYIYIYVLSQRHLPQHTIENVQCKHHKRHSLIGWRYSRSIFLVYMS